MSPVPNEDFCRKQPRRVLDLFCKAGGSAMGMRRAWPNAEIVGVDIEPQPNYPFTFVQSDAMWYLTSSGAVHDFDFIWASPPCQAYTNQGKMSGKLHPLLIVPTRDELRRTGKPFVIENVIGAPLINPTILCGSMFDLGVRRHRKFESNFGLIAPTDCDHKGREIRAYYGSWGREAFRAKKSGNKDTLRGTLDRAPEDMGIDWMTWKELTQAIPPAYSQYIAEQFSKGEK